jgi:hypothetical protein
MQLLIHFLGGENSLIVHLEFKVTYRIELNSVEKDQVTVATRWLETTSNR